jgi:hypothetical protein
MAITYEPIATDTLSTGTASVTFSSIASTYTDLILVTSAPSVGGGNNSDGYRFELNGDTGSNYSATVLHNSGPTTSTSYRETSQSRGRIGGISQSTNDVSVVLSHFLNYSNTTTYKTVLSRSGNSNVNGDANIFLGGSLWRSTAAINSIKLTLSSGANFVSGSTFTLYGIKAA